MRYKIKYGYAGSKTHRWEMFKTLRDAREAIRFLPLEFRDNWQIVDTIHNTIIRLSP